MNLTYVMAPNDEPDIADDEYEVFDGKVKIPFTIQISFSGELIANEYSPEDAEDDDFWVRQLVISRDIDVCKRAIVAKYTSNQQEAKLQQA